MNKTRIRNIFITILLAYFVIATFFYYLLGDQLRYKESSNNIPMLAFEGATDEIVQGDIVRQEFFNKIDRIENVSIVFTKYYREGKGNVTIRILDGDAVLMNRKYSIKEIPEQEPLMMKLASPIVRKDKNLIIEVSSDAQKGESVALMYNKEPDSLFVAGYKGYRGRLCFSISGVDEIAASNYYWYIVGGVGLILGLLLLRSYKNYIKGRYDYIITSLFIIKRYDFLIKQLVSRDFKSKYKRSVLGVFWSFLNPLLTMIVQFLVFSTFFRANTQNYPVYLLSGVICFNFFKETADMCLNSITGNANLINKVYIPKYIFPLAKTISSGINLFMSLIPLLVVSLLLGISFNKSIFLILFFLGCLILFSLGIGMFLSTLMVFFRDVQFLWSVICQIWQYATPIFYPAEIVPEKYRFILRFNPLYHFIGNIRKCLIDGVSPEPISYIYCLVFAVGMFIIGSIVFKKNQDKFTLYL